MAVVEAVPINHIVLIDGQPRIAEKGIKVGFIVEWVLKDIWSFEEMEREFGLTPAQIHAALSYYYDHKAEIDDWIAYQNAPIPEELLEESRRHTAELRARLERWKAERAATDNEGND